jgi:hypothetical protein
MVSNRPPSPRPSPRQGVAVSPSQNGIRVSVNHLFVGLRRGVVVDYQQIGQRQFHLVGIDCAPMLESVPSRPPVSAMTEADLPRIFSVNSSRVLSCPLLSAE